MTKPSDLFRKTGTGGASGAKMNPFAPIPGMTSAPGEKPADGTAEKSDPGVTRKRDLGHGGPGGGRAKGGGGGASTRPKV